jgi:hypothetical protein
LHVSDLLYGSAMELVHKADQCVWSHRIDGLLNREKINYSVLPPPCYHTLEGSR